MNNAKVAKLIDNLDNTFSYNNVENCCMDENVIEPKDQINYYLTIMKAQGIHVYFTNELDGRIYKQNKGVVYKYKKNNNFKYLIFWAE